MNSGDSGQLGHDGQGRTGREARPQARGPERGDPWSFGSRRRPADERGLVHRLSEGRARSSPRRVLPVPRGLRVVVLQVARPRTDALPTAPGGPRPKGQGELRGLRRELAHLWVAPRPRRSGRRGLEGVGEDRGRLHGSPGARGASQAPFPLLDAARQAAQPLPDLVKRDFSVAMVDEKWCGDLTEIPTEEGKLHLASALDPCRTPHPGLRPRRAPRRRYGAAPSKRWRAISTATTRCVGTAAVRCTLRSNYEQILADQAAEEGKAAEPSPGWPQRLSNAPAGTPLAARCHAERPIRKPPRFRGKPNDE